MCLFEIDQPAEVQFERRLVVLEINGLQCFVELQVRHDESGFQARHVGGLLPKWLDAVIRAHSVQLIPQNQRQFRPHPEFIAEIAGKAGARHHQCVAMERKVPDIEGLRCFDTLQTHLFQNGAGRRSLEGQGGNFIGHVRNRDFTESKGAHS